MKKSNLNYSILIGIIYIFLSCTSNKSQTYEITHTDESAIKDVIKAGFVELEGFNDYSRCYFEQYVARLNLVGSSFDNVYKGVLIKYFKNEFLGFNFSVLRDNENRFYFLPLESHRYLISTHNRIVIEEDTTNVIKLDFYEANVLNSVFKQINKNDNDNNVNLMLGLIYDCYQTLNDNICNSCSESLFLSKISDRLDYSRWIRKHMYRNPEANNLLNLDLENELDTNLVFEIKDAGLIIFEIDPNKNNEVKIKSIPAIHPKTNPFIATDVAPEFEINCPD